MKNTWFTKGLAFSIITLFILVSVISSTAKLDKPMGYIISYGNLIGNVYDTSGNPINNSLIRVYFHDTYTEDYSDGNGFYHISKIPIYYGMKNVTCSKKGYKTEFTAISIFENTFHNFVMIYTNQPPAAPKIIGRSVIHGPELHEYYFKAIDPEGDEIRYLIDWDDGNIEWTDYYTSGTEITLTHSWDTKGNFAIKARANDTHGAIGPWGYLQVSKANNNTNRPLEGQREIFTIVEGYCESINKTGLIFNEPIEIYSVDMNLNITGWANPFSGYIPVYFHVNPNIVKASNFYGTIFEVEPGILYDIWGFVIGDINWE